MPFVRTNDVSSPSQMDLIRNKEDASHAAEATTSLVWLRSAFSTTLLPLHSSTPENRWQRTGPLGAKSATVPSTGGQQLYPLPSRPPTAAPSRCSTPPPGLPFSSLPAAHSAENTGYEGADWQWSVSSPQSSAPFFNPGPGLSTTNAFCSAQPRSVSPLKHK